MQVKSEFLQLLLKNKLTDFTDSVSEAVKGIFQPPSMPSHRKTSQRLLTEKGSILQRQFNIIILETPVRKLHSFIL